MVTRRDLMTTMGAGWAASSLVPFAPAAAAAVADTVRAEGLRVGFYYSLMDWHHPDGARCATDADARRRFVDYIHT
jgi:hypothetical protein